jgi:hypothetical protein
VEEGSGGTRKPKVLAEVDGNLTYDGFSNSPARSIGSYQCRSSNDFDILPVETSVFPLANPVARCMTGRRIKRGRSSSQELAIYTNSTSPGFPQSYHTAHMFWQNTNHIFHEDSSPDVIVGELKALLASHKVSRLEPHFFGVLIAWFTGTYRII